ncbi:MAG: FG-GAP-like repeat-containing protein, partial [Lentisphaerota bacterium]
ASADTRSVALGDLTADGRLDVVVGNYAAQNHVLINNGTTNIAAWGAVTLGSALSDATRAVAIGDVTRDGRPDVVVGNYTQQNYVLVNDGTVNIAAWERVNLGSTTNDATRAMAIGYVDADTNLDVVVGNEGQSFVYLNTGSAPASWARTTPGAATNLMTCAVAIGDVTRDGRVDVVLGNYAQQNYVAVNNGSNSVGAWKRLNLGSALADRTVSLGIADLSQDGRYDVVVGNYSQQNYVVVNNGTTNTAAWSRANLGGSLSDTTYGVAVGDVTLDGKTDVVVGNFRQQNYVLVNTPYARPGKSTSPVVMGRGYTGVALKGLLDEVKIDGTALSAAQVLAEYLKRDAKPVVQIKDSPSLVHPFGDKCYQVIAKYDCGLNPNLIVKVAFAEEGDNGDGTPFEQYQTLSAGVLGTGAQLFWVWIPDYSQTDTDYISTTDGGRYVFRAWLEDSAGKVAASALPMPTELKWGVRPTTPLPTELAQGGEYDIGFEWEDLYETLSWENTPLTRNSSFPNRIAIFRSSKTEVQFAGQFDKANQVADWLETEGYSAGNPLDLLFDNVTVKTSSVGPAVFSEDFEDGNLDGWHREAGCANWTINKGLEPLAYYSFNEGGGGVLHDLSGNGYDIQLSNCDAPPVYVTGKSSWGMDSTAGRGLTVWPYIPMDGDWTITSWFRWPLSTGGWGSHVLCTGASGGWWGEPAFIAVADNIFYVSGVAVGAGTNLATGWHHVAAVGSNGQSTLYIDGQNWGTVGSQLTLPLNAIGNMLWKISEWGGFDEFKVFHKALNAEAISNEIALPLALRASRIGNDDNILRATSKPELKAYWGFDEGSGTVAHDSTAHHYDGTLTNDPEWVVEGYSGQALAFLNDAPFLSVGTVPLYNMDATVPWTITCWFEYPLANASEWNTLVKGNQSHVIVQQPSGLLGSYISYYGFISSGFSMNSLAAGWHHLAAVGGQGETKFYIDGVCVGMNAVVVPDPITAIGNYEGGGQPFGVIDELAIYAGALDEVQIGDLYEGNAPSETRSWTNFYVSADIQYKKQDKYFNNADLFFRYVDRDNFYKVGIRNFYGFWRIMYEVRATGAVQAVGILHEFSKTNQPAEGVWHNLSADIAGTNAHIYFDGMQIKDLPLNYMQSGGIAVGSKAAQLGIWDPQKGYYFIDDDEEPRWAPEGQPTPLMSKPMNLDAGYLDAFFPTLILPSTYVMNDTEVSNVNTWIQGGLRCLIATDGGIAMKDETGATRMGRIEDLFGVSPTLYTGLSGLNQMVINTNDHYVTLDYTPGASIALTNSAYPWGQVSDGVSLSTAMYDTNPVPALIAHVLMDNPDVPKKIFCFNFGADTGGQLTNRLATLAKRVLEWAQGEAYKVRLELKYNNGNPDLDPAIYSQDVWVLGGTGADTIHVDLPSEGLMTGDNLYWVLYAYPWDATNAWLSHGGFYSTSNDGTIPASLGGLGLQILGATDQAYAGRSWDMWVAYNTRGQMLDASYGIKEKANPALLFEENFDVTYPTVNGNVPFGDGWSQEEWGYYFELSVSNGYLRADQVTESGYSKFRHVVGPEIMDRNCSLEFDVFYENTNAILGVLYQDRGSFHWPTMPVMIAAQTTTGIWHHVVMHVRDGWVYDYSVNGDAVQMCCALPWLNTYWRESIGFFAINGDFRIDNIRLTDEEYSVTRRDKLAGEFLPVQKEQAFWGYVPDFDPDMWEHEGSILGQRYEWYALFKGKNMHAYKDVAVYFAPRLMVEDATFPSNIVRGATVSVPVEWERVSSNLLPAKLRIEMSEPFVNEVVAGQTFTVNVQNGSAYYNVTVSNSARASDNYLWVAYLYATNAINPFEERIGLDDTFRFDTWGRPFKPETPIVIGETVRSPYIVYDDAGVCYRGKIYTWGMAPAANWDASWSDPQSPEGFKCFRAEAASGYGLGWGIFKMYNEVVDPADMRQFTNGYLKFWLKSSNAVNVELEGPAGTKWALTFASTTNQWQQKIVAMTNFTPTVNFSNIYSMFSINQPSLGTFFVDHIRWETGPGVTNYAPAVNTCDDKIIYLPQTTVTVSAVYKDDGLPYGTVSVEWKQLSGPASAVFSQPTSTGTVVSFVVPGIYYLRMTAHDGALKGYEDMSVTVRGVPTNMPPIVDAGMNQLLAFGDTAYLNGVMADDGWPSGIVRSAWSKVSGLGVVTFGNTNALQTTASFSMQGIYVLRLTASDTLSTSFDDVTFQVADNQAPVVNAGSDQTFYFPQDVILDATVTDDGLPVGVMLDATWTKVSGPGTVVFDNNKDVDTTASFSQAGAYALRLTVSDSLLWNSADVAVTVRSNSPPVVDAGTNQTIVRPNSALLNASATDDGKPTNTV